MTWFYNVKTRKFEKDGVFRFKAKYAGAPGYKDDPEQQCVINKGLLPRNVLSAIQFLSIQRPGNMCYGLLIILIIICVGAQGF